MVGPLKNPRHEAFALALFEGLSRGVTQAEAYTSVGYTANKKAAEVNACRLLKAVPEILERIRELQAKTARKKQVTVESIVERLDQASLLAERIEQPAALVSAETAKAKILGLAVDRTEVGKPGEFTSLDNAQSTEDFARIYLAKTRGVEPHEISDDAIQMTKQELIRHHNALVAIATCGETLPTLENARSPRLSSRLHRH
jgi:phage terminase small subunit